MTAMRGAVAGRIVGWVVAAVVTSTGGTAVAQHDHHHAGPARPAAAGATTTVPPRPFEVGLSMTAARFDQMLYGGDYAGLGVHLGAHRGRFGARIELTAYHLRKNGAAIDGIGDLAVGVDALAYQHGALATGVGLGATLPTGAPLTGLGMGHPMLMPVAWVARDGARASLGASVGWCGAVQAEPSHHTHGAWPLVDPMSSSELTASIHGEVTVDGPFRAVAKLLVAIPLASQPTRMVAAIGGRWLGERSELGAELQAGLAGDPFTVRALVTSALRF